MSQKYTSSRQSIDLPRIQKGTRHTRDGVSLTNDILEVVVCTVKCVATFSCCGLVVVNFDQDNEIGELMYKNI